MRLSSVYGSFPHSMRGLGSTVLLTIFCNLMHCCFKRVYPLAEFSHFVFPFIIFNYLFFCNLMIFTFFSFKCVYFCNFNILTFSFYKFKLFQLFFFVISRFYAWLFIFEFKCVIFFCNLKILTFLFCIFQDFNTLFIFF